MKRLFLTCVVAVVPFAAHAANLDPAEFPFFEQSAPSQPAVVGHLDLGVGYVNNQYDIPEAFPDFDYGVVSAAGRTTVNFGLLQLELEAGGSTAFKGGASCASIGAAGHLWGSMEDLAIGVFGGANFPSGYTIYTVGGEVESYIGSLTLGADVDYNWTDGSNCCTPGDFWAARGWADLYVTADTRIGAEISHSSWGSYLGPDSFDVDLWYAAAEAEHRLADTAVSAWIEGRYTKFGLSYCGDCKVNQWSGMIGFRVFMDTPRTTLQAHDRSVPWKGGLVDVRIPPLPLDP